MRRGNAIYICISFYSLTLNANLKHKVYPVLLAILAITAFIKVLTATDIEAAHALFYNIFKTTTTKQLLWIINTIFKGNMVLYRNAMLAEGLRSLCSFEFSQRY